ncbi:phosphinothricin acetyltransferase [Hoeflea marina]|uniref:Phosphinothricin acetyltransferase n=1 Tax=Hoeflea marina TaxID=274592 RepID=A0A317PG02_9HYPH|nr:GNAT family N-acetyltransferase [Hoeflea marina]PWV98286.1 phosphinothricin acetyltransferase [Hoeflea marina]
MIIRDCRPADLPAITAIYAESVETGVASYELVAPDLAEMTRRHSAIVADGYPYVVAEDGGTIIGYAYASAFRTRPAYRWLVEDSIYLAAAAQGRGTGSALLAELLARCAGLGFRQMLAVIGGAHPASVAVHRKAGFVDAGLIHATGYKHGRWLDTALMQIALGEGSTTDPEMQSYPGTLFRG